MGINITNKLETRCSRRRQTSPRCRHLANGTKHTRRLWFWRILFIVWKHEVIHKTGST